MHVFCWLSSSVTLCYIYFFSLFCVQNWYRCLFELWSDVGVWLITDPIYIYRYSHARLSRLSLCAYRTVSTIQETLWVVSVSSTVGEPWVDDRTPDQFRSRQQQLVLILQLDWRNVADSWRWCKYCLIIALPRRHFRWNLQCLCLLILYKCQMVRR